MSKYEAPNENEWLDETGHSVINPVHFELERSDIEDYVRHAMLETPQARMHIRLLRAFWLALFVVLPSARYAAERQWVAAIAGAAVAAVVGGPIAWNIPVWTRRAVASVITTPRPGDLGGWTYGLDASGIRWRHDDRSGLVPWSNLLRVDLGETGLYVFTQPRNALIIPRRAFPSAASVARFAEAVAERVEKGRAGV